MILISFVTLNPDFRVSSDNIGVVMHSSPVEIYESLNCFNKRVEEMTADECQQCKMALTNYTFITVPDFLSWANGNVNVMLCVKRDEDIPRAITTLAENNASSRAFLEVGLGSFLSISDPASASYAPGWDKTYFVVQVDGASDVDTLLSLEKSRYSRAFLIEFHHWEDWEDDITSNISKVKAQGLRTFAATRANGVTATVEDHLRIYHAGFDVAYTYNIDNAVQARQMVNRKRGISPARR